MEVKFNTQLITGEREKRAWSQQHLADASGLALRTIQRIESRGAGSYESLRALAACLEVPASTLRLETGQPKASAAQRLRRARVAGPVAGVSLLAGIAGLLWLGTASAKQVLVDFGLTVDRMVVYKDPQTGQDVNGKDTQELKAQFEVRNGRKKEQALGQFNLVLTPTVQQDGRIALSARLYEKRDSGMEILTAPELVVADGQEAAIEFSVGVGPTSGPQQVYRVTFKPRVQ